MKKQILIKVYDPQGNYLKLWNSASFTGFVKELNAGLSECSIALFEKFDYQGAELNLGNIVEILVSDKDGQDILIYSGYISMYKLRMGIDEGIKVILLGHYTKLALDILKNGTTTTLYTDSANGLTTVSAGSSADIGKVLRAIIDRYRAENINPKINYTLQSLPDVGEDALAFLEMKTYKEAIDLMMRIISSQYNWYVNEYGIFYLKLRPSIPTHTFIFGKHFSSITVERSMERTRNALLFWNGEPAVPPPALLYKLYQDSASILQIGRRVEKRFCWSIDDEATANKLGQRFLDENKDPNVKVVCEILDNNADSAKGYDIEKIQPGDTCNFAGFNEQFADIFRENMLITKVAYSLDKVELTIEATKSGLLNWLDKVDKDADYYYSEGSPPDYTTM